jgi:hypothetical protein
MYVLIRGNVLLAIFYDIKFMAIEIDIVQLFNDTDIQ